MRKLLAAFVLLAYSFCLSAFAAPSKLIPAGSHGFQQSSASAGSATATAQAQPETSKRVTAYTLPPDLYKKARNRAEIRFRFELISFVYGLFVLWLILRWKLAPKYRDWAEKSSSNRFLQSLVYSPLLLLTMGILTLPADIYDNWSERKFGLSVQGWGSWTWDWAKTQLIGMILGTILIWLLYMVIRRSPRRWWLYFWMLTIPISVLLVFLQPLIVDPLFHKFEPLQQKDPQLTASLEKMVQRAGENIPPERMFWMGAGEKTTALNAYVTGIGASKRVVVWDNTIAKMSTPQIVFVAGHEMGHYVLRHIPKLIMFSELLLLVLFYLGYRTIGWALAKWGAQWSIRGVDDWASLPVLLLLLSVFSFVAGPISSAFSRHYEHQADQYGLEVTHGLTPDSSQVAAQGFQILGEVDLSDPEPNPVAFLFYSHPTIPDRIQFALSYDPWAKGEQPEFVK